MSYIEISSGVILQDRETLIAEQKDWDESDLCEALDFTTHPLWLTTDGGATPVGFSSLEAFAEEYGEEFLKGVWV